MVRWVGLPVVVRSGKTVNSSGKLKFLRAGSRKPIRSDKRLLPVPGVVANSAHPGISSIGWISRRRCYTVHNMKAITLAEFGGPEQMRVDNVDAPVAGPGQVLIKVEATSVNRPDVIQRQGNYPWR